jgi:glucose-6-phosphate 1-dehydrogenase
VTFFIENWRWAGVPFYVRTGKKLPKRATEIAIQYNTAPHALFTPDGTTPDGAKPDGTTMRPNLLILRIQPEEGISLKFGAKVPSAGVKLRSVTMDFEYATSFLVETPEAYERLLLDCMIGDPTLFTRADEVEAAWRAVQPILDDWPRASSTFRTTSREHGVRRPPMRCWPARVMCGGTPDDSGLRG